MQSEHIEDGLSLGFVNGRAELRAVARQVVGDWFVHWQTWDALDEASRRVEGKPAERMPPAPGAAVGG